MKKNWNDLMNVVEIMHNMGYSVSMINYKRWKISPNDNMYYHNLLIYEVEFIGQNLDLSNLECLHTLITHFVDWSKDNINIYYNLLNEKINFQEKIKPYLE